MAAHGVKGRERASYDTDITYVGFLLGHGGDALQMLSLADGVHRRGVRVKIIVPAGDESITFRTRCRELGIECERSNRLSASMSGTRQNPIDLFRLFRAIRSPIVHFHSGNSCLPRSAMLTLELLRYRRAFATLQSPYETIEPGSARARIWARTARRRLHAVICPSDHATRFQVRCGIPDSLATTVRNSIDLAGLRDGDPSAPRDQVGASSTDPIVLFSSRIDKQKRPLEAVQMFAAVADEFPSARLVFVGQGDLSSAVAAEASRRGVSDRVQLAGYQTNIPSWLAASTVWLLPTERENFSVAVLEALAAGCAVLSTNCPGNDEVLVDGQNALTYEVGDVAAGTEKLRRLLGDAELRKRIGAAAQESAQNYTVETMVDNYLAVYQRSPQLPESIVAAASAAAHA